MADGARRPSIWSTADGSAHGAVVDRTRHVRASVSGVAPVATPALSGALRHSACPPARSVDYYLTTGVRGGMIGATKLGYSRGDGDGSGTG